MELTILFPCLNEEKTLPFCIKEAFSAIERLGLDAEVLVCDNNSTDRSREIALEHGARVAEIAERGYGATLRGGIRAAKGDYILMADCDGSYDVAHPDLFLQELRAGSDLVVGDRFRGGIERGAMPFLHRLGVPFLSLLARLRFHTDVRDFHCGIRAFRREAALALDFHCDGMEFATEMIAAFSQSGAVITQVPTPLRKDLREGKPHLRTFRDGLRHLFYIFSK